MEHTSSGVWIFGEQQKGGIQSITFELLTRGRDLANKRNVPLTAVLFGEGLSEQGLKDVISRGADRVLVMEAPELEHFLCEPFAACLIQLIQKERPEIIIAGATSTGRTLMPYVAIKMNAGLTADCTILDIEEKTGNLLQTRPAIGGNIMAQIKTPKHRPQMATVRPRSTAPAQPQDGRTGEIVRHVPAKELLKSRVRRIGFDPQSEEKGLDEAETIVCAGRGLKKADHVALVQKLAHSLNGAVGATRDAVDRGWFSYPHQIGLSGKTVNPKLYIGLGVSGTIQHLAGMQTAETIIAVNKDPDAQIFRVADFGIVGDLFEIVPALISKLNASRNGGKKA